MASSSKVRACTAAFLVSVCVWYTCARGCVRACVLLSLSHSTIFPFPPPQTVPGTFHATDRVATLRKFVQDALAHEGRAFYLYTHPDRTRVENANETLKEAGLVPLRLLNFAWADGEVSKAPVLKQALLDDMHYLAAP